MTNNHCRSLSAAIFDQFISRRDHTIMNHRMLVVASLSLDRPVLTSRAPTIARETLKVRTEQRVFLRTRTPIARLGQVWMPLDHFGEELRYLAAIKIML